MDNEHTLEKLRIHERLTGVETKVDILIESIDTTRERMMAQIERVGDRVENVRTMVTGNGGVGLATKVDRIEQVEKGRKWFLRVMGAAIIGIVINMLFDFFVVRGS